MLHVADTSEDLDSSKGSGMPHSRAGNTQDCNNLTPPQRDSFIRDLTVFEVSSTDGEMNGSALVTHAFVAFA